jgi:hypothetical protein
MAVRLSYNEGTKDVERGMFPQHVRRNGDVQWPARSPDLFASTSFGGTLKVKCLQLFLGPQANTEEISVIPEEIMRRALVKPSSMTEKVLEKWRKAFRRRIFINIKMAHNVIFNDNKH